MHPTPPAPARVTVRAGHERDLDRLLEIHRAAFPDPRPFEVRRRVFTQNRLGGLENLRVALKTETGHGTHEHEIVGHAFAFPVGVWFGGRLVRGSAIASVGVALEARGAGVASALLESIHAESKARGEVFTLLYPFRQGFYARQGYAPVAPARVIEVSPRAIPAEWAAAAPGTVRPLRGDDRPGILGVYGETARLGTGFLERPTEAWDQDFLDEQRQWLVFEQAGVVAGYASLSLHQRESHARVSAEVHELVAPTEAARRRLLAALAALGDQVSELTLTVAEDDPLPWALVDADRNRAGTVAVEHAIGVLSLGPMIRLHDARAALLARGYEEDGALVFAIDDAAPFTLEVRGGRAEVAGDLDAMPARMSKASLASVAFGGLPLASAARLGWTTSTSPAVIRKAGNLLRLPPFFSLDAF